MLSQASNVKMFCVTGILDHNKNKTQLLTDRYFLKMSADNNDYFANTWKSIASALFK